MCFTVPNGTLITRYKGHVGIHGNSKHAMHLARLLLMGQEILESGQVIVKRPDAANLLAIRNGAWTYDYLVSWAEEQMKRVEEAAKTSPLPRFPDRKKINALCMDIVQRGLDKGDLWS